jgi:hypothetical protein
MEGFSKSPAELEKAMEVSPQAPNLHSMLAPVYRKQGLAEKAKPNMNFRPLSPAPTPRKRPRADEDFVRAGIPTFA